MYKTNKIPFNKKNTHGSIDSRKINVSSLNLVGKKKEKKGEIEGIQIKIQIY